MYHNTTSSVNSVKDLSVGEQCLRECLKKKEGEEREMKGGGK